MADRREEDYRGHTICVEADERRPNCEGWSYLIDGRISSISRIALVPRHRGCAQARYGAASHAWTILRPRRLERRQNSAGSAIVFRLTPR